MNLYIQIQDGQPINHPAFEENLLQALGTIPENWELFVRVERPVPSVYQVLESNEPVYAKVNGVWTDVWALRDITEKEKVITEFNQRAQASNWSAWTFDEATNTMVPPISRPEPDQTKLDAGIMTVWCGADNNWKDTPVRPEGNYKFDFFAWTWIAL
jgi:hypothetical protein